MPSGWPAANGSGGPRPPRAPPTRASTSCSTSPSARIAPEIYGHFVEHLGGVVYDGIWVGEDSEVPNVNGIRKALVDAAEAQIKPPVIRWPGGCFADSYDWRDGIGPREPAPPPHELLGRRAGVAERRDHDGPQNYEPNHFGTEEFARFCRLVGAQPYVAANLRSLPAQDFCQWVEYCNSPAGTTSLADQRARRRRARAPQRDATGASATRPGAAAANFNPEEYAAEFRRFTAWVPRLRSEPLLIGSGPNGGDLDWTRGFFAKLAERGRSGRLWGWALHHYSWNAAGAAPPTGTRARATRSTSTTSSITSCCARRTTWNR